jgi:hypothetical protein
MTSRNNYQLDKSKLRSEFLGNTLNKFLLEFKETVCANNINKIFKEDFSFDVESGRFSKGWSKGTPFVSLKNIKDDDSWVNLITSDKGEKRILLEVLSQSSKSGKGTLKQQYIPSRAGSSKIRGIGGDTGDKGPQKKNMTANNVSSDCLKVTRLHKLMLEAQKPVALTQKEKENIETLLSGMGKSEKLSVLTNSKGNTIEDLSFKFSPAECLIMCMMMSGGTDMIHEEFKSTDEEFILRLVSETIWHNNSYMDAAKLLSTLCNQRLPRSIQDVILKTIHNVGLWLRQHISRETEDDMGSMTFDSEVRLCMSVHCRQLSQDETKLFKLLTSIECPSDVTLYDFSNAKRSLEKFCSVYINNIDASMFLARVVKEFGGEDILPVFFKTQLKHKVLDDDTFKGLRRSVERSSTPVLKEKLIQLLKQCGLVASGSFLTNLSTLQGLLPPDSDELIVAVRKVESTIRDLESTLDEVMITKLEQANSKDPDVMKLGSLLEQDITIPDRRNALIRIKGRIAELLHSYILRTVSEPESKKMTIHEAFIKSGVQINIKNSKLYLKTFIKPDMITWVTTKEWQKLKLKCGFESPILTQRDPNIMDLKTEQLEQLSKAAGSVTHGLVHVVTNTEYQRLAQGLNGLSRRHISSTPIHDSTMICFEVSTAVNNFHRKTEEDRKKYDCISAMQKLHPIECVIACIRTYELHEAAKSIENVTTKAKYDDASSVMDVVVRVLLLSAEICSSNTASTFSKYEKDKSRIPFDQIAEELPTSSVLDCCDKLLSVEIETEDGVFKPYTESEVNMLKHELANGLSSKFTKDEFEGFILETMLELKAKFPNAKLSQSEDFTSTPSESGTYPWPCLEPLMDRTSGAEAATAALNKMHECWKYTDKVVAAKKSLSTLETRSKELLRMQSKGIKTGLLFRITNAMDTACTESTILEDVYGLNQEKIPKNVDCPNRSERIFVNTEAEVEDDYQSVDPENLIIELIRGILAQTYSSNIGLVSDNTSTVNKVLRSQKNLSNISPQSEKKRQMVRCILKNIMEADSCIGWIADHVPMITHSDNPRVQLDQLYRTLGYHSGMMPEFELKKLMSEDPFRLHTMFEGDERSRTFFLRCVYSTIVKKAQLISDTLKMCGITCSLLTVIDHITEKNTMVTEAEEFLNQAFGVVFNETCMEDGCSEVYLETPMNGLIVDVSSGCTHQVKKTIDWWSEMGVARKPNSPEVDVMSPGLSTRWRFAGAIAYCISYFTGVGFSRDKESFNALKSGRIRDVLGLNITHEQRIKRYLVNANNRIERTNAHKDIPRMINLSAIFMLHDCYTGTGDLGEILINQIKADFDRTAGTISTDIVTNSINSVSSLVWASLKKSRICSHLLVPMYICRLYLKTRPHEKFRQLHKMKLTDTVSVIVMAPKKDDTNFDFVIVKENGSESRFTIAEKSILPLSNCISFLIQILITTIALKWPKSMELSELACDSLSTKVAEQMQDAEDQLRGFIDEIEDDEEMNLMDDLVNSVSSAAIDLSTGNPLEIAKLITFVTKVSLPALIENDQTHNTILGAYRFPLMHALHRNHSLDFYEKLTDLSRTMECQAHELVVRACSIHALSRKNVMNREEKNLKAARLINPLTLTLVETTKDLTDAIYGKHYHIRGLSDPTTAKILVYDSFHKVANGFDTELYKAYKEASHCLDLWRMSTKQSYSSFSIKEDGLNPCGKCKTAVDKYIRLLQIPIIDKSKEEMKSFIKESLTHLSKTKVKTTWGDPYFQAALSECVTSDPANFTSLSNGAVKSMSVADLTNSNSVIRTFESKFDPISAQLDCKKKLLKRLATRKEMPLGTNTEMNMGMSVEEIEKLMDSDLGDLESSRVVHKILGQLVGKARAEKIDLLTNKTGSVGDFFSMMSGGMKNVSYVSTFIKNQIYFDCELKEQKDLEESIKIVYDFAKVFQVKDETEFKFKLNPGDVNGPRDIKKLVANQKKLQEQIEYRIKRDARKHGRNKANKKRVVLRTKVHEEISMLANEDSVDQLQLYLEALKNKVDIGKSHNIMTDVESTMTKVLVPNSEGQDVKYVPVSELQSPTEDYIICVEMLTQRVKNLGLVMKTPSLMERLNLTTSIDDECLKIKKMLTQLVSDYSNEIMSSYIKAVIKCYNAPIFELFPTTFTTAGFHPDSIDCLSSIVDHTVDEQMAALLVTYGVDLPMSMKASVTSTFEDYATKKFSTTILQLNPTLYNPQQICSSGIIVLMGSLSLPSDKLETLRRMRSGIQNASNGAFRKSDRSIYVITDLVKEGMSTSAWQVAKEAIENPDFFSICSIAAKSQFEAPRDLFVQDTKTKIHTGVAERVSKCVLKDSQYDLLVHPSAKYWFVSIASEFYREQANGGEEKAFSASSDETKWGPTHYPLVFARMTSRLRQYNNDEINLLTASCIMGSCKKVLFDRDLVDRVISMMTTSNIEICGTPGDYHMEKDGVILSVEEVIAIVGLDGKENIEPLIRNAILKGKTYIWKASHMGQGIYHATSSLIADFHCRLDNALFQRLKESSANTKLIVYIEDGAILIDKRSSDDSMTFSRYHPKKGRGQLYRFFYEMKTVLNMLSNIRKSTKHCSDSEACISEVYSTFTMSQEMAPSIKSLTAILTLSPGSTPQQTALQLLNLYATSAEEGATLLETAVASLSVKVKLQFLSPERTLLFSDLPELYCFGKWPRVTFTNIFSDPFREDNIRVSTSYSRFMREVSKLCRSAAIRFENENNIAKRSEFNLYSKWVLEGRTLNSGHIEAIIEECTSSNYDDELTLNDYLNLGLSIGNMSEVHDLMDTRRTLKDTSVWSNPVKVPIPHKILEMMRSREGFRKADPGANMVELLSRLLDLNKKAKDDVTTRSKLMQSFESQDPTAKSAQNPAHALKNFRQGQLGYYVNVGPYVNSINAMNSTGLYLSSFNTHCTWTKKTMCEALRDLPILQLKWDILKTMKNPGDAIVKEVYLMEKSASGTEPLHGDMIVRKQKIEMHKTLNLRNDIATVALYLISEKDAIISNPKLTEDVVCDMLSKVSQNEMLMSILLCLLSGVWKQTLKEVVDKIQGLLRVQMSTDWAEKLLERVSKTMTPDEFQMYSYSLLSCVCKAHDSQGKEAVVIRVLKPLVTEYALTDAVSYGSVPHRKLLTAGNTYIEPETSVIRTQHVLFNDAVEELKTCITIACRMRDTYKPSVYKMVIKPKMEALVSRYTVENNPIVESIKVIKQSGCNIGTPVNEVVQTVKVRISHQNGLSFLVIAPQDHNTGSSPSCSFTYVNGQATLVTNTVSGLPRMISKVSTYTDKDIFSLLRSPMTNGKGMAKLELDEILVDNKFRKTDSIHKSKIVRVMARPNTEPQTNMPYVGKEKMLVLQKNKLSLKELIHEPMQEIKDGTTFEEAIQIKTSTEQVSVVAELSGISITNSTMLDKCSMEIHECLKIAYRNLYYAPMVKEAAMDEIDMEEEIITPIQLYAAAIDKSTKIVQKNNKYMQLTGNQPNKIVSISILMDRLDKQSGVQGIPYNSISDYLWLSGNNVDDAKSCMQTAFGNLSNFHKYLSVATNSHSHGLPNSLITHSVFTSQINRVCDDNKIKITFKEKDGSAKLWQPQSLRLLKPVISTASRLLSPFLRFKIARVSFAGTDKISFSVTISNCRSPVPETVLITAILGTLTTGVEMSRALKCLANLFGLHLDDEFAKQMVDEGTESTIGEEGWEEDITDEESEGELSDLDDDLRDLLLPM